MTTTTTFSFTHRPLVPYAHDYRHGDSEPYHQHDCAQLLHSLSGVVRVDTIAGCWVVPPGRGVWLPAGTQHAIRITGNVAARTLFIDPLARADLPARIIAIPFSAAWQAARFAELRAALRHTRPRLTRYAVSQLGVERTFDIAAARRQLGYRPFTTTLSGAEAW